MEAHCLWLYVRTHLQLKTKSEAMHVKVKAGMASANIRDAGVVKLLVLNASPPINLFGLEPSSKSVKE